MNLELAEMNLSVDIQDIETVTPETSITAGDPLPETLNTPSQNNDRYLLCIISCEKNRERKEILKDAWVNDLMTQNDKIDILFIYGNKDLDSEYSEIDDELHVKCDDSYERLIDKMDQLWDYIHVHRNDYFKIIKCDDDNFVFIDRFTDMLDETRDLSIFGKSCTDEKFKNVNSDTLDRDKWHGPFKIGWLYMVKPIVIEEFIKNRDNSHEYIGLHEDKRFYDMIRNKYPFSHDKALEIKYIFGAIATRHPRRTGRRKRNIYGRNVTVISNLNSERLKARGA